MSKMPIVSIKLMHGTDVVTLSTMGDTTHVKTQTGNCFHINQIAVDSVYREPALTILSQCRELERLQHKVARHNLYTRITRNMVVREAEAGNMDALNAELDNLQAAITDAAKAQVQLDELNEAIRLQSQSTRIANGDGTFTEILEG